MTTFTEAEREILSGNVLAFEDAIDNAERRGLNSFAEGLKAVWHVVQTHIVNQAVETLSVHPQDAFEDLIDEYQEAQAHGTHQQRADARSALRKAYRASLNSPRIAELEAELAKAREFTLTATITETPFIVFDDGSKAFIDSWTGGVHPLGHFGGITLRFVDADGAPVVRGYQAIDTFKLGAESESVQRLRFDAMFAKMTHHFVLSRDELIELLGGKFMVMDRAVATASGNLAKRVQALLTDCEVEGVKLEVWLEPQQPLAMGNSVMRASLRPAKYPRVETHEEKRVHRLSTGNEPDSVSGYDIGLGRP